MSERSREPGFFETAKTLVLNIDSRLKMPCNSRRETISEPDADASWEYCNGLIGPPSTSLSHTDQ